jgi:flagellum-specific ATP synthase
MMPQLLERVGPSAHGSITALYTVLVEGDDHNEPITDTARSILDGHVVLDRRLANSGHFPAIDVLQSVSRVSSAVTSPEQQRLVREARRLIDARREVKELVEIGAYVHGTNPVADRALTLWPRLSGFLQQDVHDVVDPAASWAQLAAVLTEDAA